MWRVFWFQLLIIKELTVNRIDIFLLCIGSDYIRLPEDGYGNATIVSETNLVGSFRAGPRMARGVALLFGALLFKFVGLVLVYGVPVPTGVMLPSIMVGYSLSFLLWTCALKISGLKVRNTSSTPPFSPQLFDVCVTSVIESFSKRERL